VPMRKKYVFTKSIQNRIIRLDVEFELDGEVFRWNSEKAMANVAKHGVSFEQAAHVFFDPDFRLVNADRNEEARDALIGIDAVARLLYVVHIDNDTDGHIRLISARLATAQERKFYGSA
jgi:uncharacterized protein